MLNYIGCTWKARRGLFVQNIFCLSSKSPKHFPSALSPSCFIMLPFASFFLPWHSLDAATTSSLHHIPVLHHHLLPTSLSPSLQHTTSPCSLFSLLPTTTPFMVHIPFLHLSLTHHPPLNRTLSLPWKPFKSYPLPLHPALPIIFRYNFLFYSPLPPTSFMAKSGSGSPTLAKPQCP